jgi:putative transposase
MPRQARLDTPGTLHHVIVRGIEKRRIVDDKVDRDNFVLRMGQVAHETETVIYAWALMTNMRISFYAVVLLACQSSCGGF